MVTAAIFLIPPLCLALAAFTDLFTMTIPNRISAILIAGFMVVAPFSGMALTDIGMSVVGALAVFAVCFSLFAMNVMGGGDAKLLTATALWFGFGQSLVEFLVYVAFTGGILTLLILMLRSRANTVLAAGIPLPDSLVTEKKIPYAIAIAAGGFMAYSDAPLLHMALASLR